MLNKVNYDNIHQYYYYTPNLYQRQKKEEEEEETFSLTILIKRLKI